MANINPELPTIRVGETTNASQTSSSTITKPILAWDAITFLYIQVHGVMLTIVGALYLGGETPAYEVLGICSLVIGLARVLIGFYYIWIWEQIRSPVVKHQKNAPTQEDNEDDEDDEDYSLDGLLILSSLGIIIIFIGLLLTGTYGKNRFADWIIILGGIEVGVFLFFFVISLEVYYTFRPLRKFYKLLEI